MPMGNVNGSENSHRYIKDPLVHVVLSARRHQLSVDEVFWISFDVNRDMDAYSPLLIVFEFLRLFRFG